MQLLRARTKVHKLQQTLGSRIKSDISEQLFWVRSNQSLGSEFLYTLVPTVKYEFSNLLNKLTSEKFKVHTTKTAFLVVLPFIILALIVISFNSRIQKYNNELALRLDRRNDSIFVTPAAIINNMIMMVPRLSWMVVIGSIVICLSLATTNLQVSNHSYHGSAYLCLCILLTNY